MASIGDPQDTITNQDALTDISLGFSVDKPELNEVTAREIMLGESLLTPGLQTSVKMHSYIHAIPNKNFDNYKNAIVNIGLKRKILEKMGRVSSMDINQVVYRLDNRKLINNNTEEFTIRACDQSLLNDASTLVSKSWKCTSPSDITKYVLRSCAGVSSTQLDIEESGPSRDYIAENIHPFQVVAQQSNYALAGGDDPSFVHYMTYENGGTHHFRSLKELTSQDSVARFIYNDTGGVYPLPDSIMTYSFPCDFDLLSDILNGVDQRGFNTGSVALFDPVKKSFSLLGDQTIGCGLGSSVLKYAISNQNSAFDMGSCPDYAKEYLLKRQARMNLLAKDKIALRLTVPFNPILHAGKVITAEIYNKELMDKSKDMVRTYGSGDYLILHMFHHIVEGGFSVTTMDCVSTTVGQGIV